MAETLQEKLNKVFSELDILNKKLTKDFEKLQAQKEILPKTKYFSIQQNLFRDYESGYSYLHLEIEKIIFPEAAELESYESVFDKSRITTKTLEEKYYVKLPKRKFDKRKFKYYLFDPKHEPPYREKKS